MNRYLALLISIAATTLSAAAYLAYVLDQIHYVLVVDRDLHRAKHLNERAFALVAAGTPILLIVACWLTVVCLGPKNFRPWIGRAVNWSMLGAVTLCAAFLGAHIGGLGLNEFLKDPVRPTEITLSSLLFGAIGGAAVGTLLAKVSPPSNRLGPPENGTRAADED